MDLKVILKEYNKFIRDYSQDLEWDLATKESELIEEFIKTKPLFANG